MKILSLVIILANIDHVFVQTSFEYESGYDTEYYEYYDNYYDTYEKCDRIFKIGSGSTFFYCKNEDGKCDEKELYNHLICRGIPSGICKE